MQLVGKHLAEPLLVQVGHAYERATEWHRRRPVIEGDEAPRGAH
jgi:Asp-tRNA(Asn)/Glu-tRNA(Gln) amidotransferase A subunit family amidase